MNNSIILQRLRQELKENIDEHTKNTAPRYFKEKVKVYGIKTAIVNTISKKYFQEIKDSHKAKILELCESLFSSGIMEESFVASNWSYFIRENFEEKDFPTFEKWVEKYITNWASCDTLCNHTIGAFVEKYPSFIKEVKKWAKSDNRWVRRASTVSLIIPARKGKFLKDVLAISDALISDRDDLVQKGCGWLLREEGKTHQKEILGYILRNKKVMPRTTLRYAIEKMPENLRKRAMEK